MTSASLDVVPRPEKAGHHTPEDQPAALAEEFVGQRPNHT